MANRESSQFMVEFLESRVVLAATLLSAMPDTFVLPGSAARTINLAAHIDDPLTTGKIVHLETSQGDIHIQLFDQDAPLTSANFINYINSGRYNNTFFHRAVPDFVLQGGGYSWNETSQQQIHIDTFAPVLNEFSTARSNVRGTVAMAKVGPPTGQPPTPETINSATSEFFFNLTDNSSNLDSQNGGFTAFARVLGNDMAIVDQIMGLPRLGSTPVANYTSGPIQNANLVHINSVAVEQGTDISYTATSDNPDAVGVSLVGGQLTLNYSSTPGVANITVTGTDAFGQIITEIFQVGVGTIDVVVGEGGAKRVQFTDANATSAIVSIAGGGSAVVRLAGADLSTTQVGTTTVVNGTITHIESIAFSASTSATRLAVRSTGGSGVTTLRNLSAGDLSRIDARGVNLTGAANIGSVGRVQLQAITDGSLNITGTASTPQIRIGQVSAATINSTADISMLQAGVIFGNTQITAPSIGRLNVTDRMQGQLNLNHSTLALGQATIGTLDADWNITGPVGRVTIKSDQVDNADVDIEGNVGAYHVAGTMFGDVEVHSIASVRIAMMDNARFRATEIPAVPTPTVGRFTVGSMTASELRSAGSIGSVRALAGLDRSRVFAGVLDGENSPTGLADFSNTSAAITNVRVGPTYLDSAIAAFIITRADLGTTPDTASATDFYGVSADRITLLRVMFGSQRVIYRNLETEADEAEVYATTGATPPQNFDLRVI